jgi:CheY-like chemotaxis protein
MRPVGPGRSIGARAGGAKTLIRRALAGNPRIGEVVRVQDGIEALELIDNGTVKPDLAIVDLHMPRKDGFALLREFATRETARFPSVVLTSSRAGADALRSRMRGAVEFLTKPNSAKKLSAAGYIPATTRSRAAGRKRRARCGPDRPAMPRAS